MPTEFLHGVEVIQIDSGTRPIRTVRSSIIGVVGTAPAASGEFPLDTPVLVTGLKQAAGLGPTGTLLAAYEALNAQGAAVAVVVRVAEGVDAAATKVNVLGSLAAMTGVWALLDAAATTGQTPRIICAPGFTGERGAEANPVAAALATIATRLRAVAVVEGPNLGETEAIAYAGDFDNARVYVVDPWVKAYDPVTKAVTSRPASAYVAGAIAARDIQKGFWWSPSNQVLNNVIGLARPVQFHLSDSQTQANRLNEAAVATVVYQNGFRLWGNRTPTIDPLWQFLPVRRTADMIFDSIERAHLWAMDRPQSAQLIVDVRDSVQAYLDQLVGLGALLGGRCWFDPELNTPGVMQAGQVYLNFDLEPPAPLERLTFQAFRNGDYYETLALEIAASN